jgi:hypothetical protein
VARESNRIERKEPKETCLSLPSLHACMWGATTFSGSYIRRDAVLLGRVIVQKLNSAACKQVTHCITYTKCRHAYISSGAWPVAFADRSIIWNRKTVLFIIIIYKTRFGDSGGRRLRGLRAARGRTTRKWLSAHRLQSLVTFGNSWVCLSDRQPAKRPFSTAG